MNARRWRLLLRLGPAIFLTVVVVDSFSGDPLIPRELIDDKLQHVFAFAVLTIWGIALFPRRIWAIVAVLALFGATIEVLQDFTGRRSDFDDFTADLSGILLGMAVCALLERLRARQAGQR